MKTASRLISLLGFAALALAPLARAEDAPATPATPAAPGAGAPGEHAHRDRGAMRANRLKMLDEKLHLTDAQKQQIQAVFSQSDEQAKALRHDDSLSEDDRRAKRGEIMKESHSQVRALLTPEQQTTFDAMPPPERHGHRGPPKGDGDAPPPPKPQ